VEKILPGLPQFDPHLSPAVRLNQAVEGNVRSTIEQILSTPEAQIREAVGHLKLVGAICETATGHVRFLETK
jgi:carbonic anhydrase